MANNITYVKQKSGVIYAYENLGTWDKVNKKPICRRRLIGKVDILRLLKENYELKQKIEELEKKIAEATAKTEAAETVEKTKLLKQQTVHQLNNFFSFFIRQLQCSMPVYGTII